MSDDTGMSDWLEDLLVLAFAPEEDLTWQERVALAQQRSEEAAKDLEQDFLEDDEND